MLSELEAGLGYTFRDKSILENALTHSSYANENRERGLHDNERLEFLGDSILGFVVADYLYRSFPDKPEGELTRIRADLVCEKNLARAAATIRLGSFLLLGHGEEHGGGRKRDSIVSDAMESVIAASYMDGGFSAAKEIIDRLILCDVPAGKPHNFDYKTALQELVQRKDRPVGETVLAKMEWVILNDTMPPAKFAVVHWGSRLSDQDKKDILTWVAQTRKAHYATDAAPEHANEPIQPIPHRLPMDEAKVALGKTLFNDARLSADSTVACATCHAMDKAGTDNARFSEGIRKQLGDVNAPTTFNAVFNFVQFWDGRAADLQEQAGGPPLNPIEMGSKDWDEIVARLAADAELTAKFRAVYPDGWSGKNITNAIAEYEKTLISPDSRFDRWLRGDKSALTAAEVEGYERFKAYRCASCHVGKSMGGQSYEYLDLKKDYFADRGGKPLGSDKGRFNASGKEEDMHRFKVPNLRNVELTHPYLHDGTVTTLDEAVRIMGIYCSGLDVPQKDRALIVGFLRTLTGQHEGRPVQGEAVAR